MRYVAVPALFSHNLSLSEREKKISQLSNYVRRTLRLRRYRTYIGAATVLPADPLRLISSAL